MGCQTYGPPTVVDMDASGRLRISHPKGCGCGPDPPPPHLAYGRSVSYGGFRCLSLETGVRCVVVRSGKGFLISRSGVTRIGR